MPKKAAVPQPQARPIETYGCRIPVEQVKAKLGPNAQFFYWQYAFANRVAIDKGAPPRNQLFWNVSAVLLPRYFEKNKWSERLVDACCENQWIGISGCASSAKTHNVSGFAAAWWLCDPANSSVIFCSTTSKALRKRNWAEIQKIFTMIPGPRIGNFVDSRMMWQVTKGDDKHAIMGIAVEEGDTNRVADNIKGVHTKRQMVVIGEATSVPHAIFEACANLYSYPEQSGGEFILIMEANMRSWLDEFGRFVEPDKGISSVTVDTEEWETKPQLNGKKGICIRFDLEKSPNLDYPPDKPISKYLPSYERVKQVKANTGYHNTPAYWSNERGFPPPEGINKSIFSEAAITMQNARDKHKFTGENFQIIGAFDHARNGGDRPTLRFAAMGQIEDGKMGIELMPPIVIPINVSLSNPIDYQILEQVRRECENVNYRGLKMFCAPENLGIDGTGGGADLVDIFQRMWSPRVNRVVFSESPSSDPVSLEDVRPANEVYNKKRAEMYFRARNALDSGQLRGIDRETEQELVTIEFDDSKRLIAIVSKQDYKSKYGKSPDYADTVVILHEVARRKGFKLAAVGQTVHRGKDFQKTVNKAQAVFQEISYVEDECVEETDYMDDFAFTGGDG